MSTMVSRLFIESFIQAQIKENIKAPRHCPLWGESIGGFRLRRATNTENVSIWWRYHELIKFDKSQVSIFPYC